METEKKMTETLDYLRINKNEGIFTNTEVLTIIFLFFISSVILKKSICKICLYLLRKRRIITKYQE